jgi:hypothetical protein
MPHPSARLGAQLLGVVPFERLAEIIDIDK